MLPPGGSCGPDEKPAFAAQSLRRQPTALVGRQILLQQVFRSPLLKRQPGRVEQTRAFTAPDFRFPRQPAAILHGVEQGVYDDASNSVTLPVR